MIDLHVHSTHSDGTFSPAELVTLATSLHLTAFALTDHDTMSGIAPARAKLAALAAKEKVPTLIPGIELSTAYGRKDIHILGLFINEQSPELLMELTKAKNARNQRNEEMIARFHAVGIPLTMENLCGLNPETVVTRAHFAKYLVDHHHVSSFPEAFEKYLGYDAPCYVPRTYMQPEQAISVILSSGGIPVLAHPLLYKLPPEELGALIARLKAAGLVGLEVFYSANTAFDEGVALGYAHRYGLLMTGGSDFHGANKPKLSLGTGRDNNLNVPDDLLTPLYEYLKK